MILERYGSDSGEEIVPDSLLPPKASPKVRYVSNSRPCSSQSLESLLGSQTSLNLEETIPPAQEISQSFDESVDLINEEGAVAESTSLPDENCKPNCEGREFEISFLDETVAPENAYCLTKGVKNAPLRPFPTHSSPDRTAEKSRPHIFKDPLLNSPTKKTSWFLPSASSNSELSESDMSQSEANVSKDIFLSPLDEEDSEEAKSSSDDVIACSPVRKKSHLEPGNLSKLPVMSSSSTDSSPTSKSRACPASASSKQKPRKFVGKTLDDWLFWGAAKKELAKASVKSTKKAVWMISPDVTPEKNHTRESKFCKRVEVSALQKFKDPFQQQLSKSPASPRNKGQVITKPLQLQRSPQKSPHLRRMKPQLPPSPLTLKNGTELTEDLPLSQRLSKSSPIHIFPEACLSLISQKNNTDLLEGSPEQHATPETSPLSSLSEVSSSSAESGRPLTSPCRAAQTPVKSAGSFEGQSRFFAKDSVSDADLLKTTPSFRKSPTISPKTPCQSSKTSPRQSLLLSPHSRDLAKIFSSPTFVHNYDKVKEYGLERFHPNEVVRKKDDRKLLHGFDCKCCSGYYNALGLDTQARSDRVDQVSKHRGIEAAPCTPDFYWEVGMADPDEQRRRGQVVETDSPVGIKPRNPLYGSRKIHRQLFQ